ncbi:unnamed protein product [Hymenolepis diminuta]|uniref:Integrase catalytic domain-containing protein n=1 Tax=Hymenolepis diminuta TaxID=6216 RepID=A0A564Z4Q9_HYMDI|nr:unnamed protein product [Hymenolepis diminuta]
MQVSVSRRRYETHALMGYFFSVNAGSDNIIVSLCGKRRNSGWVRVGRKRVQHILSESIRNTPVSTKDIRKETEKDAVLQQALKFIRSKWPSFPPKGNLLEIYHRRDSIMVVDFCLMIFDKISVPSVLRQFHSSYPGTRWMRCVARGCAYWPGMDKGIEYLVRQCDKCQQEAKNPIREDLVLWSQTETPWTSLHVDFSGPASGITYLIVVDLYPKWPEVIPLTLATSGSTIGALNRIFSIHGLLKTLVSDDGT